MYSNVFTVLLILYYFPYTNGINNAYIIYISVCVCVCVCVYKLESKKSSEQCKVI